MDERVRTVIAIMKSDLQQPEPLGAIAAAVNLSASHLRQLFKRETGTSIGRYLRQFRMAEAKRLLGTTFLTVKQIAARVGIAGLSHFVRDFERTYGVTPARYVARYRGAHRAKRGSSPRHRQIG